MKIFNSLVSFLSILGFMWMFSHCSGEKAFLPPEIYGHTLDKTLRGEEAKSYVNQLHLQPVT